MVGGRWSDESGQCVWNEWISWGLEYNKTVILGSGVGTEGSERWRKEGCNVCTHAHIPMIHILSPGIHSAGPFS